MNILLDNNRLSGSIEAISSKSYAQRAIFAAILARGKSNMELDTLSEDIESAISCAKALGCKINYKNKILTIDSSAKFKNNIVVDLGESGTTLRFLLGLLPVLNIKAKIIRRGSLIKRTNDLLFNLLKSVGVKIREENENIYIEGFLGQGNYSLRGDISSQFISSLLLSLAYHDKKSLVKLETKLQSKPYVDMTIDVMEKFYASVEEKENEFIVSGPYKATDYKVEKDWSNSLFFIGAGVEVRGLNFNSKQADMKAMDFIKKLGYENISNCGVKIKKQREADEYRILDAKDMPDTVPILSVLSAKEKGFTKIINIERLKYKESDRIKSSLDLLNKLGVKAVYKDDAIEFEGRESFTGAEINTYNDHRIAMSAIIASSFSEDKIKVFGTECIDKSYANFLDDFKRLGGSYSVI